jgi:hypothetical protein
VVSVATVVMFHPFAAVVASHHITCWGYVFNNLLLCLSSWGIYCWMHVMSYNCLFSSFVLNSTIFSAFGTIVISCQTTPIKFMFRAVTWAWFSELTTIRTPESTLIKDCFCANCGTTISATNASLALWDNIVSHDYYKGRQVLNCYADTFICFQECPGYQYRL